MKATTPESLEANAVRQLHAGKLGEALDYAERAIEGASRIRQAHGLQVLLLLKMGRKSAAETALNSTLTLPVDLGEAADAVAYGALALGRHTDANKMYHAAVSLSPREAVFWYNLASSERSFGRLIEAEQACDRAIALDPSQYPSYLLRAELRVQSAEHNHVRELTERLSQAGADGRARMFLSYTLGKELDDLGRHDEAFSAFCVGAQTRRGNLSYNIETDEAKLRRIREVFTREVVASSQSTIASESFIFVFGLPRSGTTLVERILTGLAQTRSNGETDNFSQALLGRTPSGPGDLFARAACAEPADVAQLYAALAAGDRGPCRIVEKLPLNYLYLGAIHRALPHARLIWVRRSPLDSCFAMYRTLFGGGYPFSYDFLELARYFYEYDRLMAHWRDLLGGALIEVSYEALVAEPNRVGAELAAGCDLPWDPEAIRVQDNASVSLTASASQIRRPIYGTSSGKWRQYRTHLEPLISALRERQLWLPPELT